MRPNLDQNEAKMRPNLDQNVAKLDQMWLNWTQMCVCMPVGTHTVARARLVPPLGTPWPRPACPSSRRHHARLHIRGRKPAHQATVRIVA